MTRLFQITLLLLTIKANAQFIGKSGVYYLGAADIPISATSYGNANISGVVVRFMWDSLEKSPNQFDWTFIDGEIAKAQNAGKKISLQPLGAPKWIASILNAQEYYYIDKNQYHSTYGQMVSGILPWDSIYLSRIHNLIEQLSLKYSTDTTVSYINAIGGQISRNMPDTILSDTTLLTNAPFWTTYNYNADSLASKMYPLIDYYMSVFPKTPLWCSVDYVLFELHASSRPRNYLASLYTNYGITHYPDRFGLWREDISGCTSSSPPAGSQWTIMKNNPCRTGAQMLWNVQDGPSRMNQCGILPNTKSAVLDSAVHKGLEYGMRYLEIYAADINDASLSVSIQQANGGLLAKGIQCSPTTGISDTFSEDKIMVFPNPTSDVLNIELPSNNNKQQKIEIYNSIGLSVKKLMTEKSVTMDIEELPNGIYFIKIGDQLKSMQRYIKQ